MRYCQVLLISDIAFVIMSPILQSTESSKCQSCFQKSEEHSQSSNLILWQPNYNTYLIKTSWQSEFLLFDIINLFH